MALLKLAALLYCTLGFTWFTVNIMVHGRGRKRWWLFLLSFLFYTAMWPFMLFMAIRSYRRVQQFIKPFSFWWFVLTGQRRYILILLLVSSNLIHGQCGSVYDNGIEYKIPCDWDYLKHSSDSLRKYEKLFIKYLNEERVKRNLKPLVFDQSLYDDVAIPQTNKMAQDAKQSHTTQNVFECVGGVFYGYRTTNLAKEGIEAFQWIAPNATFSVHWRILMNNSIEKVAVGMAVSPSESNEKDGLVYISVVML